jgi:hypothetical protein
MSWTPAQLEQETITLGRLVSIIGVISGKLASPEYADAWNGNAPDWFPEPPEWLELLEEAYAVTEITPEKEAQFRELAGRFPDHEFPATPTLPSVPEEGITSEDFLDQYPQVSAQPPVDPEAVDHDCGCGG